MSQKLIEMPLPKINKEIWAKYKVATPLTKMPNCDNCGDDELGMIAPNEAFCYKCCTIVKRRLGAKEEG